MPSINFDVSIDDTDARRVLDSLIAAGADLSPVMMDIGEAMLLSTEDRFNSETDPDGRPWEPLAASTRKQKKHSKILTESTNLRGRITYQAGADNVEWGTDVIYARIHQEGGQAGRNLAATIPARKIFGISSDDRDIIQEKLQNYLASESGI